MELKELVGKKIHDIRFEIKSVDYEGSISLEESFSEVILESGEIFDIPYNGDEKLILHESPNPNQRSIFPVKSSSESRIHRNASNIIGKQITAVYQYTNSFSSKNREWEKCIIELETGFLFSEVIMSPQGTGHTGVWIFTSLNDLNKRIGTGYTKVVQT